MAPPEIVAACCTVTRYNLATGDGKTCSEEVKSRYERSERWLRDISLGTVRLDLDEVTPTAEETADAYIGRGAVFR